MFATKRVMAQCIVQARDSMATMNDNGISVCLYINRTNKELAIPCLATRNPWRMNEVHERLGHANKDATREMVKGLNLKVIPGNMGICWACMVA